MVDTTFSWSGLPGLLRDHIGASSTSLSDVFLAVMTLSLAYGIGIAVYRAFFGPLAHIAGPRLAAMTYWYEAYFEVWLGGQYFKHVAELHRRYGPVVRITPHEVHFNDPDFIESIYPGPSRKTNKPLWFAERTGTPLSIVSTPDHDLHRRRRNAVSPFFSVTSVRRLEDIMKQILNKLLSRMTELGHTEDIVQAHGLFKACASDVITTYAFGECSNFMDQPDFGRDYFDAVDWFFHLTHFFGLFPGVVAMVQNFPSWVIHHTVPFLSGLRNRQDWWIDRVRAIRASPNPDRVKTTIFDGILNSNLPREEKSDKRMASEAQLIVFAGEGTTAYSLQCCLFHLLDKPVELAELRKELNATFRDMEDLDIARLENLPYLNAIIQETVRLHPGVMARQVRMSPVIPIVYKTPGTQVEIIIPPMTVTSMSATDIHLHTAAFGEDALHWLFTRRAELRRNDSSTPRNGDDHREYFYEV